MGYSTAVCMQGMVRNIVTCHGADYFLVVMGYKCRFCILREFPLAEAHEGMTSNLSVEYFNLIKHLILYCLH